jgi:hypothetical protein
MMSHLLRKISAARAIARDDVEPPDKRIRPRTGNARATIRLGRLAVAVRYSTKTTASSNAHCQEVVP